MTFGSLFVSFVTSGHPFELRGRALDPFGCLLRHGSNFESFPGKLLTNFGGHFGQTNLEVVENCKTHISRKQCRKSVLAEVARNSTMCDPYNKYHMFRRVEGSRLERVLSSFGVALGVPWALFLSKVAPWRI